MFFFPVKGFYNIVLVGYNKINQRKAVRNVKKWMFLFCCLLCVGFGGRAMAAEHESASTAGDTVLCTRGMITAIENGAVTIQGEGAYREITLHVNADTYLNDGKRGRSLRLDKLKVGDAVSAYYDSAVTRSLPPQGNAVAVVRNSAAEEMANGVYIKAGEVTLVGDTANVLSSNGDLLIRIERRNCRRYAEIKPGDELLVWYQVVTLSLPGQTNAERVVLLEHK